MLKELVGRATEQAATWKAELEKKDWHKIKRNTALLVALGLGNVGLGSYLNHLNNRIASLEQKAENAVARDIDFLASLRANESIDDATIYMLCELGVEAGIFPPKDCYRAADEIHELREGGKIWEKGQIMGEE